MSQARAVTELVLAGMFWGLGFIATIWSLRDAGPLAISGWRFVLAGLFGVLTARKFIFTKTARQFMKAAWLPGSLIAATIVFQTWGLLYTTATKSGFLTCLYVLIVPLLEPLVIGVKLTRKLLICSLVALVGVGLMCGLFTMTELDEKSRFNIGDILTIICAFAASAHIFAISNVHEKLGTDFNGYNFNIAQSFGAGLPTLALALAIEPGTLAMPVRLFETARSGLSYLPLLGFLSLTFGSTLIGFALQVRAQRVLSPSTASLLFLLESPFAALFALIFLGEKMDLSQMIGGLLILSAVAYSSLSAIRPGHATL